MFYTYIIESEKTGNWYIGHTDNLERRIKEHNSGKTSSTKGKGLWIIIFTRSFNTKIEANRFELQLKRLRNKELYQKNI